MNGVHNTPHPKSCACRECQMKRAVYAMRGRLGDNPCILLEDGTRQYFSDRDLEAALRAAISYLPNSD